MRVLIVDDDRHMRRLVKTLLEGEGMECFEAGDGFEALSAAREIHPDVILLDVMLPGLDGYKISRMLKFDENFADIGVIMVTSRSRPGDEKTGFNTGADAYITKPFKHEELVQAVKDLAASKIAKE
jgi:two-component system alkaline phosphatase synthesis response regulator PhoP/two-component system response regulator VicR